MPSSSSPSSYTVSLSRQPCVITPGCKDGCGPFLDFEGRTYWAYDEMFRAFYGPIPRGYRATPILALISMIVEPILLPGEWKKTTGLQEVIRNDLLFKVAEKFNFSRRSDGCLELAPPDPDKPSSVFIL